MIIFQEKPGVISEGPIWVAIHQCWLYTADTLEQLIIILYTEWEDDKHLC